MGIQIRMTSSTDLHKLARHIRDTGDKGMGRHLGRELNKAAEDLNKKIGAEAAEVMPKSGGYRDLLVASLRYRTLVKSTRHTSRVVHRVYGDGKGRERRDTPRLDKGELRHPVWGRKRRRRWTPWRPRKRIPGGQLIDNPWATTSIKPGFWSRPVDAHKPEIIAAVDRVVRDFLSELKE